MKVERITWNEGLRLLSSDIRAPGIKATLFSLIKSLSVKDKSSRLFFVKAEYNYGEFIAQDGKFVASSDSTANSSLSYCKIPLGLLLDNSVEVNAQIGEWRVATTILQKHSLLGVFETADYLCGISSGGHSWDVTAGSASVRLNYPVQGWLKTKDHFRAAKQLAAKQKWTCSILYFTKDLLDTLSKRLPESREFLLRYGWNQNQTVLAFSATYDTKLSHVASACSKGGCGAEAFSAFFWFFLKLLLVMKGYRPAYQPVELTDNHLGPLTAILEDLRAHRKANSARNGYYEPMMFVPAFVRVGHPLYLSICDASPGFHGTQLPSTARTPPAVLANALGYLQRTSPSSEIFRLARAHNVTPFSFEKNIPWRGTGIAGKAKPLETGYQQHVDDEWKPVWNNAYLKDVQKPYHQIQFFKTLVGLYRQGDA